jgi:hypothetical protein
VDRDDEELLELEAPMLENMSTSHTLVLSEEPPIDPETSAPAHVATETSAPARSPRALKRKKSRTCTSSKEEIVAGSLLTPLLDDVRDLTLYFIVTLLSQLKNYNFLVFVLVEYFYSP